MTYQINWLYYGKVILDKQLHFGSRMLYIEKLILEHSYLRKDVLRTNLVTIQAVGIEVLQELLYFIVYFRVEILLQDLRLIVDGIINSQILIRRNYHDFSFILGVQKEILNWLLSHILFLLQFLFEHLDLLVIVRTHGLKPELFVNFIS
jgi:hypothetical protein